jgi:hypothetical protein
MEERERCYSFILSRTPHGTYNNIEELKAIWFHHHHQPINVPTVGAQAFLMDYGTYPTTLTHTLCLLCSQDQQWYNPYGLPTRRTGHNPPREPSADWWVLTTANAAGNNGLTCLPKHGGARGDKVLVTHPMTEH